MHQHLYHLMIMIWVMFLETRTSNTATPLSKQTTIRIRVRHNAKTNPKQNILDKLFVSFCWALCCFVVLSYCYLFSLTLERWYRIPSFSMFLHLWFNIISSQSRLIHIDICIVAIRLNMLSINIIHNNRHVLTWYLCIYVAIWQNEIVHQ